MPGVERLERGVTNLDVMVDGTIFLNLNVVSEFEI